MQKALCHSPQIPSSSAPSSLIIEHNNENENFKGALTILIGCVQAVLLDSYKYKCKAATVAVKSLFPYRSRTMA